MSVGNPEPTRHVGHRPIAEAARRQAAGRRARAKRQPRVERGCWIEHERAGDRGVRCLRGGAIGEDAAGSDSGQNRPAILGNPKPALELFAQLLDVRVEIVTVLIVARRRALEGSASGRPRPRQRRALPCQWRLLPSDHSNRLDRRTERPALWASPRFRTDARRPAAYRFRSGSVRPPHRRTRMGSRSQEAAPGRDRPWTSQIQAS